jgi:hypothetical protein
LLHAVRQKRKAPPAMAEGKAKQQKLVEASIK